VTVEVAFAGQPGLALPRIAFRTSARATKARIAGMRPPESMSRNPRRALPMMAMAAAVFAAGCVAPIDMVHRVSVDVQAHPKDLRACVGEAIRGVDGVPGLDPPAGGVEQALVEFRTTLPYVSGEVERQGADGVRVSIEVLSRVEPDNFWSFAQPRAKAIGDAIVARCAGL
jgi:hypothetical protein